MSALSMKYISIALLPLLMLVVACDSSTNERQETYSKEKYSIGTSDTVTFYNQEVLTKKISIAEKTIKSTVQDPVLEKGKETNFILQNSFFRGPALLHFFHPETAFGLPAKTICVDDQNNAIRNKYEYNDKGLLTKATHEPTAARGMLSKVELEYDEGGNIKEIYSFIGSSRNKQKGERAIFTIKDGKVVIASNFDTFTLLMSDYSQQLISYDPSVFYYEIDSQYQSMNFMHKLAWFSDNSEAERMLKNSSIKVNIGDLELSDFSLTQLINQVAVTDEVREQYRNDPISVASLSLFQTLIKTKVNSGKNTGLFSVGGILTGPGMTWSLRAQGNLQREFSYDSKGRVTEILYFNGNNMKCQVSYD